jgi:3-oxoadipate enol-lactonase
MFWKTGSRPRAARPSRASMERLDISELHFAEELPEGRFVELPGRGQAFVRIAQGPAGAPTVLLVHGLLATADLNWSLAMPVLASRFKVVAPDLRGHGRGLPTRRFDGEECADDLAAIVETLELGRVIVVGYSLGGLVAQLFARAYPELVAGLVLCATACTFEVPTEQGAVRLLDRIVRRAPERLRRTAMMAILAPKNANCPNGRWLLSEVRRHDTLAILDAAAEAGRFNSSGWLGEIDRPAVVMVTSLDPVVAPDSQRRMAGALARAEVVEVAGDHFACIKRPDDVNAALLAACSSILARAARPVEPEYSVPTNGVAELGEPARRGRAAGDASGNADVPVFAGDAGAAAGPRL